MATATAMKKNAITITSDQSNYIIGHDSKFQTIWMILYWHNIIKDTLYLALCGNNPQAKLTYIKGL